MPFPPATQFSTGFQYPAQRFASRVDPRAGTGMFNQSRWTRFNAHQDSALRANFVSC